MDWEANLAAIIKCTDANLEQQFRQFTDLAGDLTTYSSYGQSSNAGGTGANAGLMGGFGGFGAQQGSLYENSVDNSSNIGAAYFRESMASHLKHSGGGGEYSVGGGVGMSSSRSSGMPTSFSDDFRKRQERKRSGEIPSLRTNRAAAERFDNNNENEHDDSAECDEEFIRSSNNNAHHHQYSRARAGRAYDMPYSHMYSSPTYDMAQMMEQVRLSLKLEVDARAAIAERQLSALLNLCKASTEEMDRLRVEVCANDRQIHTLDQVQAKLRQELTTQKDIGFHLQSLCGKDESWRMQAENQLLELRQLVAAVREQGNSLYASSQEKLSRAELIVQFNASIEPIKAQFHANLQHQAHQIAEITRTTSSSSLLLDALTQKVNRGLNDEIADLRNELYALKSHVAKMNTMLDGTRNTHHQQEQQQQTLAQSTAPAARDPAEEAERARQKAKQRADMVEEIKAHVLLTLQDRFDTKAKDVEASLELRLGKTVAQQQENTDQQYRNLHSAYEERSKALTSTVETQIKSLQQHMQSELNGAVRDTSERLGQLKQQLLVAATSLVEAKATVCQNRQLDLLKMVESEQKERKTALEALQESCRASRYALEDQVHAISHETRAKAALLTANIDTKVLEIEKSTANATITLEKEVQRQLESISKELKAQVEAGNERLDSKLRALKDDVAKLRQSVASLTARDESSAANELKKSERERGSAKTSESETSAYLETMEATLQKIQLQLQLQTQAQVQAQTLQAQAQAQAAQAQMQHPPTPQYWVTSPQYGQHGATVLPQQLMYASYQVPAAPILASAPSSYSSGASTAVAPSPEAASESGFKPSCRQNNGSASAPESKAPRPDINEIKPQDRDLGAQPILTTAVAPETVPAAPVRPTNVARQAEATVSKTSAASVTSPSPASQVDPVEKIQQTIAATVKGALAEAEMAKLRVENRRKQENELRQQQQQLQSGPSQPLSEPSIASQSTASATNPLFASSSDTVPQKALEQRPTPPSRPQLARAASVSALPSGALPHATTVSTSRLSDAEVDDAEHKKDPIPRPRSNSLSGATTDSLAAQVQQNALASQSIITAQTGKPPPPPPLILHPQSPLVPRPAVSTTSEAKAGLPVGLISPRTSPSAPSYVSSNPPPTSIVRAATAPPVSAPAPSHSAPPPANAALTPDLKPSTPMGKPPPPSPMPTVSKPAVTQPPASSLAQSSSPSESSHVLCVMCRLPVRTDQKQEHERSQCSKRTLECTSCHNKVLWSDVDAHARSCEALSPNVSISRGQPTATSCSSSIAANDSSDTLAGSLKKCRHCNADIASQELFDHELRCDKMLKQCPHCLRRQKVCVFVIALS